MPCDALTQIEGKHLGAGQGGLIFKVQIRLMPHAAGEHVPQPSLPALGWMMLGPGAPALTGATSRCKDCSNRTDNVKRGLPWTCSPPARWPEQ